MNSKNIPQQLEHYFLQVGRVVWAWNHMQSDFYYIFEAELDKNDKAAKALWDKCPSDFAQRELLKGLLEGNEDAKYKECVYWALREADNLSSYRNAIVHARILPKLETFHLGKDGIEFGGDFFTSKDKHVTRIDVLINSDKFEDLISNILSISNFLFRFRNAIPPFDSLPEIPLLRTLPARE